MLKGYFAKKVDWRYVYIMLNPRNGKIKIGIARNTENRRLEIDKDNLGSVKILAQKKFIGAQKVESRMHNIFKKWHSPERSGTGRTEWFKLPFLLRWSVMLVLWYLKQEQRFCFVLMLAVLLFIGWEAILFI